MDAAVAHFIAITDASSDTAAQYLSLADGDLETALTFYLEAASHDPIPASTATHGAGGSNDAVEDDEAMARRLQQESGGAGGFDDTVRSPIAPRVQRLDLDDDSYDPVGGIAPVLMDIWARRAAAGRSGGATARLSPFGLSGESDDDEEPIVDDHRLRSDTSAGRANRLAQLFRPPYDILTSATFESARSLARTQRQYLLVNLQDPTEFDCQRANRDLWKDERVKELVRRGFVFIQIVKGSEDGMRFEGWYGIGGYPHIAVVDPRTGERMREWNGLPDIAEFIDSVTMFLEDADNLMAEPAASNTPAARGKDVMGMTEDEMLAAAIAASVQDSDLQRKMGKKAIDLVSDDEDEADALFMDDASMEPIVPKKDAVELFYEPEVDHPDVTRIQFRMLDGSRVVRRFLKTWQVSQLFAFVRTQIPSAGFELTFVRDHLGEKADKTIGEVGLANAMVNVSML